MIENAYHMAMWYAHTYQMIHTKCYNMWFATKHDINVYSH